MVLPENSSSVNHARGECVEITEGLVREFKRWLKQDNPKLREATLRQYMYYIPRLVGVKLCGKDDVPKAFKAMGGVNKSSYEAFSRFLTFLEKTRDVDELVTKLRKALPKKPKPKVVRPRRGNSNSWVWVREVVRRGLPDGRQRFILYTLTPYLANVEKVSEDEGLEIVKEFLEASCRNHGNCGKVYDSWVRASLRGAARKGIRPRGLRSWEEKDPEVFELIKAVLNEEGRRPSSRQVVVGTGPNPYAARVLEFVRESGLEEFSYDDFKRWLEQREGRLLNASEWQGWERRLRQLVSEGLLGRKYLVNGVWVDYGSEQVTTPPSKTVKFYVVKGMESQFIIKDIRRESKNLSGLGRHLEGCGSLYNLEVSSRDWKD